MVFYRMIYDIILWVFKGIYKIYISLHIMYAELGYTGYINPVHITQYKVLQMERSDLAS